MAGPDVTAPMGVPPKRRHPGWLTALVILGAVMGIFGAMGLSNTPTAYNNCIALGDSNCAQYKDAHTLSIVLILLGVILFLYGGIRLMQRGRPNAAGQMATPIGMSVPPPVAPPPSAMPPGWYQDATGIMRWWDGTQWTASTQPPSGPRGPQEF